MKKADFDQLFVLVYTNSFQQEVPAELCFDVVDDLLTAERVFHHPAANPSIVGKGQETESALGNQMAELGQGDVADDEDRSEQIGFHIAVRQGIKLYVLFGSMHGVFCFFAFA